MSLTDEQIRDDDEDETASRLRFLRRVCGAKLVGLDRSECLRMIEWLEYDAAQAKAAVLVQPEELLKAEQMQSEQPSNADLAVNGSEPVRGSAGREPECHGLDTPERVCFYEQDFYVLSNFSAFTLEWRGIRFDTSEAAYHWEKFHEWHSIQLKIQHAPSAHEAFKVAEFFKAQRRADWDDVKVNVMRRILSFKAEQHEYVRRKLLATGDRELVENSWRDDFWGWGPNRDGQNMLGKLWMEVRAELRAALTA